MNENMKSMNFDVVIMSWHTEVRDERTSFWYASMRDSSSLRYIKIAIKLYFT